VRIPFGKFKGIEVSALPDDYILWLITLDDLREPLRSAVQDEYVSRFENRSGDGRHSVRRLPDEVQRVASELIDAGYRGLAKKFHPDAGGSHDAMILLSEAREWLSQQVRGAAV
jgi:hypothetical protein